jgi:hypothetical protein
MFDFKSQKKKKGNFCFALCTFYGRFLSINRASRTTTTITKANRPTVAGTKYMSATDAGVGVGAGVSAGAEATFR